MDNRPIGFFDSGVGGLTSIPHLFEKLPNEKVIFFGDTARTPYGSKSPNTINLFAQQIGDFLMAENVKMIVIACNTVSAIALDKLRERFPDIPIIGVISPTARVVANQCSANNKIGVMATKATVESGAYINKIIEKSDEKLSIFQIACPALVPLIEEGFTGTEIMRLTLKHYLDDFITNNKIDTLVLGCTHYPLVKEAIKNLYPKIKIISSSEEVIEAIAIELEKVDGFAVENNLSNRFYASDLSAGFTNMIKEVLGEKEERYSIRFKNLDI